MLPGILGDSTLLGGGAPGAPESWRKSIRAAALDVVSIIDALEKTPGTERGYTREFDREVRKARPATLEERIAAVERGEVAPENLIETMTVRDREHVPPTPEATELYGRLSKAMQRLEALNVGPR